MLYCIIKVGGKLILIGFVVFKTKDKAADSCLDYIKLWEVKSLFWN